MIVMIHHHYYTLLQSNTVNTDTIGNIEGFHINKVSIIGG